jgi:hypothetical protein
VAVDVTPVRPESEQLINQAIIKKAKADGLENIIKIDSNGNLQNREQLLQEFIVKFQKAPQNVSKALASREINNAEIAMYMQVELQIESYEAQLLADLALNQITPVRVVAASQTATNSELFMYLGALILMLTFINRRRLAA